MTPKDKIGSPRKTDGLTVLLVDDDRDALEELADIVDLEGWHGIAASSVETALDILDLNRNISVVVTDVHFVAPGGETSNGLQLASRALAQFPDRQLSFVVLSGDPGALKSSIQVGAIDFLSKPLVADDLVAAIKRAAANDGAELNAAGVTKMLIDKVQKMSAAGIANGAAS